MKQHLPHQDLLTKHVRVLVVGCGGTGSAFAGGLPDLHHSMIARGHSAGLHVTLMDGDVVSEANCVRQPFSRGEIGHPKATVLATRYNLFYHLAWVGVPSNLQAGDSLDGFDIVVGCVDSRAARRLIADLCAKSRSVRYWLDFGNLADSGQYVLGQPINRVNPATPNRLPTAAELMPEIVDTARRGPDLPSCSAAEAITRQRPFLNRGLADAGLTLLDQLFSGGIVHHGGWFRLAPAAGATRLCSAIPIPTVQEESA